MKKWQRRIMIRLAQLVGIFVMISLILVVPLRWVNPPVTMVMLDRWHHSQKDTPLKQTWLAWDDIPDEAVMAVISSEDQLFFEHTGFDFNAIVLAIKSALQGKRLRGASTISQQVARNVYLWTGRSWFRKGLEVWFTLLIELCWSKQRILEVYLNIAEWGEGVFGLEAASRYHFQLSSDQLTPYQLALLASSLPSPLKYQPAQPATHLIKRAQWNLQQQQHLGGASWLKKQQ